VLAALHDEQFVDQAPATVYNTLLDRGTYLCSTRTMYRLLEQAGEVRERRDQLRHPPYQKPELLATGPNQVWSWDITKLRGPVKWTYFYLYVVLDVYSRHVVGWMLADRENAGLARRLIRETAEKQGIHEDQLTLHSDRGSPMVSHTLGQLLTTLGITPSFSRPRTCTDNPFSESHFRTLKYQPQFPKRFGSYEDALSFCRRFFQWYNEEHYHSGIAYLTPATVHEGRAAAVRAQRQDVLDAAYQDHPERFVNKRPTTPELPPAVWINPPTQPDDHNNEQSSLLTNSEEQVSQRP